MMETFAGPSCSRKDPDAPCAVDIEESLPHVLEGGMEAASASDGSGQALEKSSCTPHLVKEVTMVPPDGGLRPWLSIFSCFCLLFLASGLGKAFGVIKKAILAEFVCNHSVVAMIPGVFSAGTLFWAPVTSALIRNYGARFMLAVGCALVSVGFMISGSADSGEYLVLSLGLFVGTGFSFVANYTVFVIGKLFKGRKPLALGLALTGGCVGHEVLPRLFRVALPVFGPREMFGFLTVASAVWILICLYIVGDAERQMVPETSMVAAPEVAEMEITEPEAEVSSCKTTAKKISDELGLPLMADCRFWLVAVPAVLFGLGSTAMAGAMERFSGLGFAFSEIFCVVSSVVVRLTFGIVSANTRFSRSLEYAVAMTLATLSFGGLTFLPGPTRWIPFALGAFCTGAWAVLIPATLGHSLGAANIGKSFALVKFLRGLVSACWLVPKSELGAAFGVTGMMWLDFECCVAASIGAILLFIQEKRTPVTGEPAEISTTDDDLVGSLSLLCL